MINLDSKINPYSVQNDSKLRNLKVVYGQGKSKIVSRFLQKVPCKVDCDMQCNIYFNGLKISGAVTNYVIVDTEYLMNYSETLELIDNVGFIITLSSLIYIQGANRRLYYKLKKLFEDPAKTVILFQNEYHEECFLTQTDEEEILDFVTRQNFVASHFYLSHMSFKPNVVLLTNNTNVALIQYQNLMRKLGIDSSKNVEILNLKEYMNEYQKDNLTARELVDSLEAAITAIQTNTATSLPSELSEDVVDYLPDDVLSASLKSGDFVKGILRVNKFRSREEANVVITEGNSSKQLIGIQGEVLIQGSVNRNRSIDGDSVIIKVLPESQWVGKKFEISGSEASAEPSIPVREEIEALSSQTNRTPTGKVVGIYKRNWRDYVCSYEKSEMNTGRYVLVTPFDRKIPRIRIGISDAEKLVDQRFIIRIDGWSVGSKYPNGHFVENIGKIGDLETETKTLLIEYKLYNRPFTTAQLAELPINTQENPWKMNPAEISKRRDLRDLLIFSIDPIGCQDVDDALSIRRLANGNIELGVHIADVTHFVAPHSLLDLEARRRSTSIYMADRRFDMLPHVLSGDLCSLWSEVDRYAVSVLWEMTPEIEVINVEYCRSVIRSRYKLCYELAQDIFDNKVDFDQSLALVPELAATHIRTSQGRTRFAEMKEAITMLLNLAIVLKARRIESGGLELEGMEVQVKFTDPDRTQLEDLQQKEPLEMHETIAECMIFANHWVAKKCYQHYPTRSCLRRHPPPRADHFSELMRCADVKGFSINVSSNLELAKSLDRATDAADPEFNKILRSLATLAMSNAEYFSTGMIKVEDFYHYGLALPTYTHFTSPIRRYADILVHRLLLCAIDGVPEESLLTNSALADQCDIMNRQHRQAQFVQRASIELFQAMFFKNKSTDDAARYTDGVIVQLRSNGVVVQIPRYGIKGTVYLKKQDNSVAWVTTTAGDQSVQWLAGNSATITTQMDQHSIKAIVVCNELSGGGGGEAPHQQQQVYRLFDRIRLRIDVAESKTFGLSLQIEFVGTVRSSVEAGNVVVSRTDIFQSVRDQDESKMKRRIKYVDGGELDPIEAIGTLHSVTSLCHLFREFKRRKLDQD